MRSARDEDKDRTMTSGRVLRAGRCGIRGHGKAHFLAEGAGYVRCRKPPGLPSAVARPGCRRPPVRNGLIRGAFLLEEEPGHAGRRQSSCQRGGLLVRACLPQPASRLATPYGSSRTARRCRGSAPALVARSTAACSTSMKSMAMPGVPPGPRCANVAIGVAIRAATGRCRGSAPEQRPGERVGVSYAGDGLFRESASAVSARS
jgi:hypothetical protein